MVFRRRRRETVLLALCGLFLAGCEEEAPVVPPSGPHPPATIQDLRASAPDSASSLSSLLLRWTVPRDPDTQGPPAIYELRYDTTRLEGAAWLEAAGQVYLSKRGEPGATDSTLVTGLAAAQLHFFVIRSTDADGLWSDWSNVASLATFNVPPVASFVLRGSSYCPEGRIEVDASASADLEDTPDQLLCRWDWESDGVWDTPWTSEKTATHAYAQPGSYRVRLQVRDRGGATAEEARVPSVVTLDSWLRSTWEEVPGCCEYYSNGTCARWCSFLVGHYFRELGPWGGASLSSFVSPDSFTLESKRVPDPYGIQGMDGNVHFEVCGHVRMQVLAVGPVYVKITGPSGVLFEALPDDPAPAPVSFSTLLTNGSHSIRAYVTTPASVRVYLTRDEPRAN